LLQTAKKSFIDCKYLTCVGFPYVDGLWLVKYVLDVVPVTLR